MQIDVGSSRILRQAIFGFWSLWENWSSLAFLLDRPLKQNCRIYRESFRGGSGRGLDLQGYGIRVYSLIMRQYWEPDSDAVNSIDSYEGALWFSSRGDECLNCGGAPMLLPMYGPLIIRIHKSAS